MALPGRAARLAPVVDMAEEAERKAAQRLGQFQQQVATAQAKLAELERFREDYQLQWINRGGQGVNGSWLVNYQRFLGQLETAMTQQRQSLVWHQNNLNNARGTWQQAYARVEGLRNTCGSGFTREEAGTGVRDQISQTTLIPKLRPGMVKRSMLAGWVTAASPWPS